MLCSSFLLAIERAVSPYYVSRLEKEIIAIYKYRNNSTHNIVMNYVHTSGDLHNSDSSKLTLSCMSSAGAGLQ